MMYLETKQHITKINDMTKRYEKKEYAIVLGASVYGEHLSGVLKERVNAAINLYKNGLVKKILMSGDGAENNYNEPVAMKKFALKYGVPEEAIYIDRYGFNTYDSILRSKLTFHIQDAYIISQSFHVGRALWIAQHLGINVHGIAVGSFRLISYYTLREFFARFKDFWQLVWLNIKQTRNENFYYLSKTIVRYNHHQLELMRQ